MLQDSQWPVLGEKLDATHARLTPCRGGSQPEAHRYGVPKATRFYRSSGSPNPNLATANKSSSVRQTTEPRKQKAVHDNLHGKFYLTPLAPDCEKYCRLKHIYTRRTPTLRVSAAANPLAALNEREGCTKERPSEYSQHNVGLWQSSGGMRRSSR